VGPLQGGGLEDDDRREHLVLLRPTDKVWVEDPDGNAWEVFVVKGEAAVMGEGPVLETQASGAACCVPKAAGESGTKAAGGCC
jgi:hypothetical protein